MVELDGQLHRVLSSGQEDGGSILRKLLRTPRQLASMSECVARQLLRMPRPREVPSEEDGRQGGQPVYKHERRVHQVNHGVQGAHASIAFQCKHCWLINLEGHPPVEGLDDAYVMLICQANLDAMGGRAVATIEAHATAIRQAVSNCQLSRKMPSIPPRGPMLMGDSLGMGPTIEHFSSILYPPFPA